MPYLQLIDVSRAHQQELLAEAAHERFVSEARLGARGHDDQQRFTRSQPAGLRGQLSRALRLLPANF